MIKKKTIQKRQAVDQEGAFKVLPDPPAILPESAHVYYFEAGQTMVARRSLNAGNFALLLAYAQEQAVYFETSQVLAREGFLYKDKNGQVRQHPLTRVARAAFQNVIACAQKLMLTPEIQQRLPVEVPRETTAAGLRISSLIKRAAQ